MAMRNLVFFCVQLACRSLLLLVDTARGIEPELLTNAATPIVGEKG
jgi:hypothetical protein